VPRLSLSASDSEMPPASAAFAGPAPDAAALRDGTVAAGHRLRAAPRRQEPRARSQVSAGRPKVSAGESGSLAVRGQADSLAGSPSAKIEYLELAAARQRRHL
jgi:hypothetical protein